MPNRFATHLPSCTVAAALSSARNGRCSQCFMEEFALCGAVDNEIAAALRRSVAERSYKAQEIIASEGEPADYVGIVRAGVAGIVKYSEHGRRQVCGFLEEGDVFGLVAADEHFANVEALTDVAVCLFPRRVFEDAIERHPKLAPELMRAVSNQRMEAAEHELLLGQFSGRERLAAFLIRRASRFGRPVNGPAEVVLETTRRDIGDYLGLSLENVSRGLNDFARQGLIEMPTPRRIILKDARALESIGHMALCPPSKDDHA